MSAARLCPALKKDTVRNDFTVYWAPDFCSSGLEETLEVEQARPAQPGVGRMGTPAITRVTGRVECSPNPVVMCGPSWQSTNSFNSDASFYQQGHTTPRSWPALPFRLELSSVFFGHAGMWDLSSQTRDWTQVPSVGSAVLSAGPLEKSCLLFLTHLSLPPGWNV